MTQKTSSVQNLLSILRHEAEYGAQSDYAINCSIFQSSSKQPSFPLSEQVKQALGVASKAFKINTLAVPDGHFPVNPLSLQRVNGGVESTAGMMSGSMAKSQTSATILSPSAIINGLSQAELGDQWWKKIHSIPIDKHFGIVDDGTDARGRRGSVEKALEAQFDETTLFIGGGFGEITQGLPSAINPIKRTIVLPQNGVSTIFLPILNGWYDNVVEDLDSGFGNQTVAQLLNNVRTVFNTTAQGGNLSKLFASIDGNTIVDPLEYRQSSGVDFTYTTPFPIENSLIGSLGVTNDWYLDNVDSDITLQDLAVGKSVTIGPAVSDGYWLAIDIAGGAHTINFGGTLSGNDGPFFDLDITYDILNPVNGTNKSDNLTGTDSNDYLDGGNGKDIITGNGGDDLLVGGNAKDVIDGGIGSDELWGDLGNDTFIFKKGYGNDTIYDFSRRETVEVKNFTFPPEVKDVDLSAVLDFGGGDVLTFEGVQKSDLLILPGLIAFI